MVFRIYMLAVKAPGLTLEEFKHYWDNDHLNLLKEIGGDAYPDTHVHRYPMQVAGPEDARYDGIGYLEFKNKEEFFKLKEIADKPENKVKLEADEKKFLDKSKIQMYVVDDDE